MVDNNNYPALEMSLQQAHPRAGRTLLDWLFGVRKSIPPCAISTFIVHVKARLAGSFRDLGAQGMRAELLEEPLLS